jgi:glutaredoxin
VYRSVECCLLLPQVTEQPPADPYALPAATGHVPKSITVYQYEVCPFCCKVKTFLDYHKVSCQQWHWHSVVTTPSLGLLECDSVALNDHFVAPSPVCNGINPPLQRQLG